MYLEGDTTRRSEGHQGPAQVPYGQRYQGRRERAQVHPQEGYQQETVRVLRLPSLRQVVVRTGMKIINYFTRAGEQESEPEPSVFVSLELEPEPDPLE